MDTTSPELHIPKESEQTKQEKSRVEQAIEKVATGLGESVGFLADKGILFVFFALIWVAFGIALVWSQGTHLGQHPNLTARWSSRIGRLEAGSPGGACRLGGGVLAC